ncbi:helix-turn-helix transcriptional regulator [Mycobacterium sp. 1245852.3]|uniref:helix-turn-helix domain-containing protein n=1 Tax=Mycobacterium sp. 1245852.3 TaxID=1856860 RepID=UPI000A7B77A6|nr:helix-turn-helix transcriptional regulator [Mycobacterium sp. 1245852.3]
MSRSSPTLTPPIKPRSTRHAAAGLVMELAEVVYRVREVAGLTQAELARKMGTTQSAIAAIESGARTPAVELLEDRETRLGALRQALIAGESGT